jgi:hypothetical protein
LRKKQSCINKKVRPWGLDHGVAYLLARTLDTVKKKDPDIDKHHHNWCNGESLKTDMGL